MTIASPVRLTLYAFAMAFFILPQTAEKQRESPNDFASPASEMRPMLERYATDRETLAESESTPFSSVARDRMRGFYSEWTKRLDTVRFEEMTQSGKVDYLLLRNQLGHELRMLDFEENQIKETEPLVPFASAIVKLAEDLRRMHFISAPEAAAALEVIKRKVEDSDKSLKDASPSPFVANRAANEVDRLQAELKRWFDFYNGYDPQFTWWVPTTNKQLDADLQSYATNIREQKAGIKPGDTTTIIGNPIGRDQLISELQHEMIAYTPEELLVLAAREFAWCENEMMRASSEMGYTDWHKALDKVKSDYVEPGKQPELIHSLVVEAINFVQAHDLVTVPEMARESWRMEMMTAKRQLINPFFTGGDVLSVSYPTDSMSYEQKMMSMRGNNMHFARATVFHELIPGHELQGFFARRYRPWRQRFGTPFYVEGWSLYWEMLFWDLNFAKSPEDRIGMLFWRMHRAARILFSFNYHLGKWTPQQCVDFLVDKVGHERENAAAEVRRSLLGQDPPLYQAAYMLGGLQLRRLRKELVDSHRMTDRQFHDAVLKENAIPIELVRAELVNETLTRDFKPTWKFYGEVRAGDVAKTQQHALNTDARRWAMHHSN